MEVKRMKAKVCLVGEPAAEKTALIRRFVLDSFDDRYITTVGTKVSAKELTVTLPDGSSVAQMDMRIWDIMGQKGFKSVLKDAYFYGTQGIIAVCDATRKGTLEALHGWIEGAYEVAGRVPVVFLANKVDQVDARQITDEDLRAASEPYGRIYFFTSAKTGENVEAAFQTLAELIVARMSKGAADSM